MTIMTGFDPEEFLRLVEAHRVTVVQMVPTMFVRMLALPAGGTRALRHLLAAMDRARRRSLPGRTSSGR